MTAPVPPRIPFADAAARLVARRAAAGLPRVLPAEVVASNRLAELIPTAPDTFAEAISSGPVKPLAQVAPEPYAPPNITLAAQRLDFATGFDTQYTQSRLPITAKAQELAKVVQELGFVGQFQWGGRWSGRQGEGTMHGRFFNGEESIEISARQVRIPARDRTFTDPGNPASEYEALGIAYYNGNRMLRPADLLATLPAAAVADSAADKLAQALTSGELSMNGLVNGYESANGFQRNSRMGRHADGSWLFHDDKGLVVGFTDPDTSDTVVVYPLRAPTALPTPDPVPTPPPPPPPPPKPKIARLNVDAMAPAVKAPTR